MGAMVFIMKQAELQKTAKGAFQIVDELLRYLKKVGYGDGALTLTLRGIVPLREEGLIVQGHTERMPGKVPTSSKIDFCLDANLSKDELLLRDLIFKGVEFTYTIMKASAAERFRPYVPEKNWNELVPPDYSVPVEDTILGLQSLSNDLALLAKTKKKRGVRLKEDNPKITAALERDDPPAYFEIAKELEVPIKVVKVQAERIRKRRARARKP
jgi:hypothetical protein